MLLKLLVKGARGLTMVNLYTQLPFQVQSAGVQNFSTEDKWSHFRKEGL
jgi:hypothetical protein